MIIFIILTIYLGFLTAFFVIKAIKAESERRFYFFSVAFFSFFYMICRLLLLINSFISGEAYSTLYILGSFFAVLGVAGLMFAVEKYVYQKLKFIPTIIVIIFAVLIMVIPQINGVNYVTYWVAIGTICAIIIPILYLKVGFKSSGEIRKNSLFVAFGIIIFLMGNGMNTKIITDFFPILLILAPIAMLIGLLLFQIGLK